MSLGFEFLDHFLVPPIDSAEDRSILFQVSETQHVDIAEVSKLLIALLFLYEIHHPIDSYISKNV
jgi:hypothetical protein